MPENTSTPSPEIHAAGMENFWRNLQEELEATSAVPMTNVTIFASIPTEVLEDYQDVLASLRARCEEVYFGPNDEPFKVEIHAYEEVED